VFDFLSNPIALGHWLKHYFVSDPYIKLTDDRGNKTLECQIVIAMPDESIGGKSYLKFMRPLFEQHIAEANETDLNFRQYPPVFINLLGISHMQATLTVDERVGHRKLPHRILAEIATTQSSDITEFLKAKRSATVIPAFPKTSAPTAAPGPRPAKRPVDRLNGLKRILVLCPLFGASSIYYSDLLTAIMQCASRYGYELSVQPIVDVKHKRPLHEYAHLPSLSGVIAITCQVESSTWLAECREADLPIALIHDNIEEAKLKDSTVVSYLWPNLDGLRDLISHLIHDHQRRNICVVMVNPRGHRIRQQKLDIIRNTVFQEGLPDLDVTDRDHLFYVRTYTHEEGRSIVSEMLENNPTVDAVVCLADVTAVGILQELKEHKRDDILVTGFDNIDRLRTFN
jgi:DNA-binding LacI/PurR family transcriptional regulator